MSDIEYKLSDEVIAQIAKLVQLAILTGTDVVDNLRMLRMTRDNMDSTSLNLSDRYRQISEDQIAKMLAEIELSTVDEALSVEDN